MNKLTAASFLCLALCGCGDDATSASTAPASQSYDHPASDPARNLTPMDQGATAGDIGETTAIRKALMAASGISLDAQNIKIITHNGMLTVRGAVDSITEHQRVCQVIEGVIGTTVYDDQLTVKR